MGLSVLHSHCLMKQSIYPGNQRLKRQRAQIAAEQGWDFFSATSEAGVWASAVQLRPFINPRGTKLPYLRCQVHSCYPW